MKIQENLPIKVTEVRLMPGAAPVLAYADITINDGFVVHGVRIVKLNNDKNKLLVCMPSKPHQLSCKNCSHRNPITSKFCGQCGTKMHYEDVERQYMDIAHPIKQDVRKVIEESVIKEYNKSCAQVG